MSIEAFQIASAVFGASTVGLVHLSYGLHKRLKSASAHVANLQAFTTDQAKRLDEVIVQNAELNGIVTKVHDQRRRALERATLANKARAAAKAGDEKAAVEKTLGELKLHPLRPRDVVLADIRASNTAQQVSSAD
jgi:hypothetical protein